MLDENTIHNTLLLVTYSLSLFRFIAYHLFIDKHTSYMSSSKKKSTKRIRAPDSESDCESEPPSSGDDSDNESASASTSTTSSTGSKSKPKKKQKVMIDLESGKKANSKASSSQTKTKAKLKATPKTLASSKTCVSTSSTSSTSSKMSGVIFSTTASSTIAPPTDSAAVADVLMSALAPSATRPVYQVGQKVVARWKTSYPFGQRYGGVITAMHSDGKLTIRYGDGDVWIDAPADAIVSATPMPAITSSSVTTVASTTSGQQAQRTTGTTGETGFLLDSAMRRRHQQHPSTNSAKPQAWLSNVIGNVVNYMNGNSNTLPISNTSASTLSGSLSSSNSHSSVVATSASDMNMGSVIGSAYNHSGPMPSSTFDSLTGSSSNTSTSTNTTASLPTLDSSLGKNDKLIDLTDPEQVETLTKLRFRPPQWRRCGLEPHLFVSDVKQQPDDSESIYTCPVCQMVAWRPVAFPCGHIMCFDCLEGQKDTANSCLRSGSKYKCPTCRAVTDNAPTEHNALVKKIFGDFKIHCPGQSEYEMGTKKSQCDYVGNYWEAAQHLTKCPFETVDCTCTKAMPRKDLQKHQENDCCLRTIKCQHCGEMIQATSMDAHKSLSCLAITVANIWCKLCKRRIDKGSFVEHMAESMLMHAKALATAEDGSCTSSTSMIVPTGQEQSHMMQNWLGKTVIGWFGSSRSYGRVEGVTYFYKAKKWMVCVRYDDGDCNMEDPSVLEIVPASYRNTPTASYTEAKTPQNLAWLPAPSPRSGLDQLALQRHWTQTVANSLCQANRNHINCFFRAHPGTAILPLPNKALFPDNHSSEYAAMYREVGSSPSPSLGSGSSSI